MKVQKYGFPTSLPPTVIIDLPLGAELLSVSSEAGRAVVFVRTLDDVPLKPRGFRFVCTGQSEAEGKYIGTITLEVSLLGWLPFHVFDLGPL